MSEAVVVSGLVKSFPGVGAGRRSAAVLAVDDVSFAIDRGGALAIVGESGSGKTTVARCLAGLEVPTRGTIEVCGERWTAGRTSLRARRRRARNIQLVFQDPYQSLDPRQKVGEALDEALSVHGLHDASDRESRVVSLLDRVGLSDHVATCYPRVLSGGQRQRVAIARALAAEPEVMVFDESVAALDVSIQAQVLNLISDLREETGLTTIFISHDLAVVRQVSESIIVMRRGVVVEHGPTASVLDAPADRYTMMLIASVPRIGWDPGDVLRAELADAPQQSAPSQA
jgi:peptide/nickel transport system ATP-binding protein